MALMNEPKVLLLDEPTAGINPTLINGLIDRLQRANREFGITMFIIEHNMRVIMNMAEHIYCLAHGELLAEGSPAAFVTSPSSFATSAMAASGIEQADVIDATSSAMRLAAATGARSGSTVARRSRAARLSWWARAGGRGGSSARTKPERPGSPNRAR